MKMKHLLSTAGTWINERQRYANYDFEEAGKQNENSFNSMAFSEEQGDI